MSNCSINHSKEDVMLKLKNQKPYLFDELFIKVESFLLSETTQSQLNELFHLLKKYDLASKEEQIERNNKLLELIK